MTAEILVALTRFQCLKETSGTGDDEVAAFFRVTSTDDDGSTRVAFTGFTVEHCRSGDRPIDHPTELSRLTGVSPIGRLGLTDFPPGIELLNERLAAERRPVKQVDVTTIGLEIDGSDSTTQQAAEHMADFISTGRIDPTIGVNDDVLWSLSWGMALEGNDELRRFGVGSAPIEVDDGELTGLVGVAGSGFDPRLDPPQHIVVVESRNHDHCSRHELTFAFAARRI